MSLPAFAATGIDRRRFALLVLFACALSAITVYAQFRILGYHYLETTQIERHQAVLDGTAGDSWQYRVLSDWLVEAAIQVTNALGIVYANAFLGFRLAQNVLIFVLGWLYFRTLGLPPFVSSLGVCLLGWGMSRALFDSDLQFSTYSDMIFYLAAGLLILHRRYALIVPLMVLAALNRETSGLIPLMLLAVAVQQGVGPGRPGRRPALFAVASLAACAVTIAAVRIGVGPGALLVPYGHEQGSDLFMYNVGRDVTWINLFETLNLLPFLALAAWKHWPRELKAFGVAIVPLWLLIHFPGSVVAETRLFLVPQVMVFIPGALMGIYALQRPREPDAAPFAPPAAPADAQTARASSVV